MCVKLGRAASGEQGADKAFERYCVDLRSMQNVGLHGFPAVPPPYRMWIWRDDLLEAAQKLSLN